MKVLRKKDLASKDTQLVKLKTILIGITLSEIGGSQKVVFDLISNLPESHYSITLVTAPNGELIDWVDDLNGLRNSKIRIITLKSLKRDISFKYDIKAFFDLLLILKRGKYDIAHFHNSKIGILGRFTAKIARVPQIYYTVHGWGINASKSVMQYKIMGLLEGLASRLCTKVICVSNHDLERGVKNGWIQREKSCVIYNGISDNPKMSRALRKELAIPDEIPLLATISRLSEPKDPIFTIKAAEILRRSEHDFRLVIIGDGPLRKDCETLITDLGLEDYILILGTQNEARGLLGDVDVVLLFSKWEGLPIAIIEAMFAGKPVIASCVGGIPELVKQGLNGYLLYDFDAQHAARYIEELICDHKLIEDMGTAGRGIASQQFTLNKMVKKYQEIYSEA